MVCELIFCNKKESPNEGTETFTEVSFHAKDWFIKKNPRMRGRKLHVDRVPFTKIATDKKESPNEGTETALPIMVALPDTNKKESPNEGTETGVFIHR